VPPQFGRALASGQAVTLTTTAGAPPQSAETAGTAGTVTTTAGGTIRAGDDEYADYYADYYGLPYASATTSGGPVTTAIIAGQP
jgi:hypothetical protein